MRFRIVDMVTLMLAGAAYSWCQARYGFDARIAVLVFGAWACVTFRNVECISPWFLACVAVCLSVAFGTLPLTTLSFWIWLVFGHGMWRKIDPLEIASLPRSTRESDGGDHPRWQWWLAVLAECPAILGTILFIVPLAEVLPPGTIYRVTIPDIARAAMDVSPLLLFWMMAFHGGHSVAERRSPVVSIDMNWLPMLQCAACADSLWGGLNYQTLGHSPWTDFLAHVSLWASAIAITLLPLSWYLHTRSLPKGTSVLLINVSVLISVVTYFAMLLDGALPLWME